MLRNVSRNIQWETILVFTKTGWQLSRSAKQMMPGQVGNMDSCGPTWERWPFPHHMNHKAANTTQSLHQGFILEAGLGSWKMKVPEAQYILQL